MLGYRLLDGPIMLRNLRQFQILNIHKQLSAQFITIFNSPKLTICILQSFVNSLDFPGFQFIIILAKLVMQQSQDDFGGFQVLPELSQEEGRQLQEQHVSRLTNFYLQTKRYAMPSWYPALQKHTFESYAFPLTTLEAYLLNLTYQERHEELLIQPLVQAKHNLTAKVDAFIKQHFQEGCFFKLQTRSPKDFSWRFEDEESQTYEIGNLVATLQKNQPLQFSYNLINTIYKYFLEKSKSKIKVTSGQQFIQIFSKSERIQIDINDLMYISNRVAKAFDQKDFTRADEVLLNVWGRKWVDCHWMEEFRCFFNHYQLNAITQYDQRCYFQQLNTQQPHIQESIARFFQQLVPSLKQIGLSSGVMDIIFNFTNEKPTCQLIQVNIFNQNSRGSLFSWEKDEKVLKQGPLQARFHKQPIVITKWQLLKMMGMIQRGIQKIMNEVMKKLGFQQQWKQYE